MRRQKTNELLEAFEALTKPVRGKVLQPDEKKPGGVKVTTVVLPCLLDQMRAAITASIGGSTRGASDPSTRNILDTDALYTLMRIDTMVKSWARIVGAPVTKNDTARTLRGWYPRYTLKPTIEAKDRFYIRKMRSWAGEIKAKLDRPNVMDLPDRCPVCGNDTWWSTATHEEYKRPLIIEYRPDGPDMVQNARALCRACEQVWGVRELQWEIEHTAQA